MPGATLDFWFDFASTYSYPAAMRIGAAGQRAPTCAVRFRPFLLGPIFKAQGWATSPFNLYPAKGRYMWRDLERLCADLDVPFRRPDPFPQNSLLAARVALVGLDRGLGRGFLRRACSARNSATAGGSTTPRALGEILAGLQVDPQPVLAAAQSDANKARLRAQTEEAQRLGMFGAPSFTTADGELFWGNDRLEAALRWASGGAQESSE